MKGQVNERSAGASYLAHQLGIRMLPLVVLLATVVSLGAPSAFLAFGLLGLGKEAKSTAHGVATLIEEENQQSLLLWKYNAPKLVNHLRSFRTQPKVRRVAIIDADGRLIGDQKGTDPRSIGSFANLWASAPIVMNSREVGHVWVALSTTAVYRNATLALGLFSMLGLTLAILIYWLPLKSVRRAGQTISSLVFQLEESRDALACLNQNLEQRVSERSAQLATACRELRVKESRLREITSRAIAMQEGERRSIARELHDAVGQALTAIRINLQIILEQSVEDDRINLYADKTLGLVDEALEEVRRAVSNLGPAVLEDVGLVEALERYCEDFAERTGLEVSREINGTNEGISPALESTCYRIVQEAFTNVAKHASASRVSLLLRTEENFLVLEIRDDGRGMESEHPPAGVPKTGLAGIQERVFLFGGALELDSAPGKGARLHIKLPCEHRLAQHVDASFLNEKEWTETNDKQKE